MPNAMDPMTLAMLSGDPDALATMRQYALASQLQQMALGGPQQPQQLGLEGRYPHAARLGVVSALAPLAEALMARQGFKTAGPAMSKLYGGASRAFADQEIPGTPLQAAPPPSDPNAQGVQPLVQRLPGASFDQTVQATQPQTVHSPMNPLGLPPNLALQAYLKDPAKYAELIAGTPEWRTALQATGSPQGAMRMLQAEARAKAFKDVRPGSTGMDFLTGQTTVAPDPARGEQYLQTPQGLQAAPIPGSSDIQAARATQLKAGQESVTPHYEPDPFHPGQTHIVYPPGSGIPSGASGVPSSGQFFPSAGGGTAAHLEQQKKGAESGQGYSDQLNKNAENATEVRRSLAELKNLAGAGGVSVSNPAKLELGSYLIAAGMNPQTVGNLFHTDVGALVAASKQTGSLALDSIHSMTSKGTNFDLATFMRYNPNLDMGSPEGFHRVLDFMDKRMQQEIAKQIDFDKWSQTQPPNRWASGHTAHWLGLQNKLISLGASNSGAPPITAQDIQAEKQRRGLQ